MINPCQANPTPTTITLNSFAPNALFLDHPDPKILPHVEATDTVSEANSDPTFCGAREYAFERVSDNADASLDLFSIMPNKDWQMQASSSDYSTGVGEFKVYAGVSGVDHGSYPGTRAFKTIEISFFEYTFGPPF